jgi:hypothetical protein
MMTSDNPYKQYERLFEGWPEVKACQVGDENGMVVAGRHHTPGKLKMFDTLSVLAAIFWASPFIYLLHDSYHDIRANFAMWCAGSFGIWGILSFYSYSTLHPMGKKLTCVLLSSSHIDIGGKVYDARVQHKFTMSLHRKAKEEADAELRAQQRDPKRADTRKRKYYRDAYHIYLEYLGQRRLVADIYGEENAENFLRALNAVDRIIHKEDSVYAANSNVEEAAGPKAQSRYKGHFGKRPALD